MKTNSNKLGNIIGETLMISMIKMLVFQEVKKRPGVEEDVLRSTINNRDNDFYKPSEQDLKGKHSFNTFIKKLSQDIIKYI